MNNQSKELKDIWNQISHLVTRLKKSTSQFEKDSIKSDLAVLENNRSQFIGMASQFEKDLVTKDLNKIKKSLNKFLHTD